MSKILVGTSAAGKKVYRYTGGANDPEYIKDSKSGFKQTNPMLNLTNMNQQGSGQQTPAPTTGGGGNLIQSLLGLDKKILGGAANFLFPRTSQTVSGLSAATDIGQKLPQVEKQTSDAFSQSQSLIKQAQATKDAAQKSRLLQQSRDIMSKAGQGAEALKPLEEKARKTPSPILGGLGIAGEAATWALPIAAEFKGATALARIGESASLGGVMGAIHGVTTPEEMPLPQRVNDGVKQALGGAIAGAAAGGALEAARALATRLSGLGKWMVRGIIKPETGTSAGWAQRESQATDEILSHVKGNTPQAMDKNLTQYLTDTTTEIRKQLGTVSETPLRTDAVKNEIKTAIQNNVQGFDQFNTTQKQELARLFKFIDDTATVEKGVETSNTALSLFDAKSKGIANYLDSNKVWSRLEKDPGSLSIEDKMGLAAYDTLKSLIDRESPGISALTEVEHRLLQGSKGIYKWGHRYKSPDLWNLRALPIANRIFDAIETGEIAAGRAFASLPTEQNLSALISPEVKRVLSLIISGGLAQTK